MPTVLRDRLVRGERGDGEQKAGDDSDDSGGGGEGEEKKERIGDYEWRRNRSSECADRQASGVRAAHAIKDDGSR